MKHRINASSPSQVISRTAPEAAARVLSDMSLRMVSAYQSRSRSYKNLRRAATDNTAATGGYIPAPKKAAQLPMQGGGARRRDEARGGIATIAFLAVGHSKAAASTTVRRCAAS
jgi:hypothetical protein